MNFKIKVSGFYVLFGLLICCTPDIKKQDMTSIESSKKEQISTQVKAVEHELFNAIQNKDTTKLSTLLTEKFTYHNPNSGDMTRDEFIANIGAMTVEIESIGSDNLSVKVMNENQAIITGIQNSTVLIDDEKRVVSVAFTDIFIRENDRWLLDFANGIDLP